MRGIAINNMKTCKWKWMSNCIKLRVRGMRGWGGWGNEGWFTWADEGDKDEAMRRGWGKDEARMRRGWDKDEAKIGLGCGEDMGEDEAGWSRMRWDEARWGEMTKKKGQNELKYNRKQCHLFKHFQVQVQIQVCDNYVKTCFNLKQECS